MSSSYNLETRVPQGSILSVTVFATAVNSIAEYINPSVEKGMYVDDLAIFYSADTVEEMEEVLQNSINETVQGTDKQGFNLFRLKTKAVHFCSLRTPHNHPQLYINEMPIEYKETVKFLGLKINMESSHRKTHVTMQEIYQHSKMCV